MTDAPLVLLLAGAADRLCAAIARAVLMAGGKVAAAVPRAWQVENARGQLLPAGIRIPSASLLLVSYCR